jgi:2-oxoglutarate ferredoxin oxidoreductase subunit beta
MDIQKLKKLNTKHKPTWCPGCGDYSIWHSLKQTITELEWEPHQFCICYDIGCSGNMCSYVNAYGFHGLHGRSLPVAAGIKMANHNLPVIVVGGDGGLLGEGMGHMVHFMRANHDVTLFIHDNQIYGLTTGQTSPTTEKGIKTKSNPHGGIEIPINPLTLALTAGATFIARGFAGDPVFTQKLMRRAIDHKGFSIVDIFQPCVTFNHHNTYSWFRDHVYYLNEGEYNSDDKVSAYAKSLESEKLPIGVIYEDTSRLTYEDELEQLKESPLVGRSIEQRNIEKLLLEFL